jgi:hypothetical protein
MASRKALLLIAILIAISPCLLFSQQQAKKTPERDRQSINILMRAVLASGGPQAVAAVRDITQTGEITFHWTKDVKGPITIRSLGSNHFRMEADLPQNKRSWVIRNGTGFRIEGERHVPMTDGGAVNLENLTYPIAHVAAALGESAIDISFEGIEKRNGRSIYRLRVKGQLGLASDSSSDAKPIVKDLLIDALTFDIMSVEDRPSATKADRSHDTPSRAIEYGDFRLVNGVRIPFSISTRLMGQKTLSIALTEVTFNSNLSDEDFK